MFVSTVITAEDSMNNITYALQFETEVDIYNNNWMLSMLQYYSKNCLHL